MPLAEDAPTCGQPLLELNLDSRSASVPHDVASQCRAEHTLGEMEGRSLDLSDSTGTPRATHRKKSVRGIEDGSQAMQAPRDERGRATTTRREEVPSPRSIVAALPTLRTFARRLGIGSREEEWDLVQDTIVRALSATAGITRHMSTQTWLTAIMRNLHIDRARRRIREPSHLSLDEAETDLDAMASCSAIGARVADISLLLAALEALPHEFRGPFESFTIQGLSYREVAKEYGISLATVGTRLHRARAKLKELLLSQI